MDVLSRGFGGVHGCAIAWMRRMSRMCHRVDAEEVMDVPSRGCGGCAWICHCVEVQEGVAVEEVMDVLLL